MIVSPPMILLSIETGDWAIPQADRIEIEKLPDLSNIQSEGFSRALSFFLSILPVLFLGKSFIKKTFFGILK